MASEKAKAASISVLSNTILIIIKVIAGTMTGSVSMISEAIHSGLDLLAAIIAWVSVRVSDSPADRKHPYGHGKYENVSGVIEALLIFGASVWIIIEAIHKIKVGGDIEAPSIGIAVMGISVIVNFLVSRHLYKVARKEKSIALEADALHLKADVITSAGVGLGLLLIWITGYSVIDPYIAIAVAVFIMFESWNLLRRAYSPLVDSAICESDIKIIEEILQTNGYNYHELKTRLSGKDKFAEFHLEVSGELPLSEVHEICDKLEADITARIESITVTIHAEPVGS
jgi:cation diffusion facilitator family transporter